MHPWCKITSASFMIFLVSYPEATEHKVGLSVQHFHFLHLVCSPSAHTLRLSPPSLLVFIFLLPWGVILTDIAPPAGQMLKLKHAIHQPKDTWVAQQTGALTSKRHSYVQFMHTHIHTQTVILMLSSHLILKSTYVDAFGQHLVALTTVLKIKPRNPSFWSDKIINYL